METKFVKHTIEIDIPEGDDPLEFLLEALTDAMQLNFNHILETLTTHPYGGFANKESYDVACRVYRENIDYLKRAKSSINIIA